MRHWFIIYRNQQRKRNGTDKWNLGYFIMAMYTVCILLVIFLLVAMGNMTNFISCCLLCNGDNYYKKWGEIGMTIKMKMLRIIICYKHRPIDIKNQKKKNKSIDLQLMIGTLNRNYMNYRHGNVISILILTTQFFFC